MEQHLVPQHIASFEFKLFGNLTIRQFVTLAIPASVAGIIFFSGAPDIIRYPLSGLLVGFGLLIALVPFGGRPFHKWIMAFFKAILSPTQRIWIKEEKIPEFLEIITRIIPATSQITQNFDEKSKEKLLAFLKTLPKGGTRSSLDVSEQLALQNLHLDWHAKTTEGKLPPPIVWPSDYDLTSKTSAFADSLPQIGHEPSTATAAAKPSYQKKPAILPKISAHAKPYVLGGIEERLRGHQDIKQPKSHLASETNFATENIIPIVTPDMHIKLLHGIGKVRVRKLHFAPPFGFDLSKLPVRGERQFEISGELKSRFHPSLDVPHQNPQAVVPKDEEKPQIKTQDASFGRKYRESPAEPAKTGQAEPQRSALQQQDIKNSNFTTSFLQSQDQSPAILAQMAQMVPLTNKPNVISGIVLSSQNTPLAGAILIIRDETGVPVRALKSNRLGQFLSATSLPEGNYQIEIEAEDEDFEPVALALNNQVQEPIKIEAKGGQHAQKPAQA